MDVQKLAVRAVKAMLVKPYALGIEFRKVEYNEFPLPRTLTLRQTQQLVAAVNEKHHFGYQIVLKLPSDRTKPPFLKWNSRN